MVTWLVLLLLVLLAAFPRSMARWRGSLFKAVDRVVAEAKLSRIGFWLVAVTAMMAFGAVFTPELAWLAAIDTATYVEVLAAVTLAGAAIRIDAIRNSLAVVLTRMVRKVRTVGARVARASRRVRKPRLTPPPEEDRGFAFA